MCRELDVSLLCQCCTENRKIKMQETEQKRQTEVECQEHKTKSLQDEIQTNIEVYVSLCSTPCLIPPSVISPSLIQVVHCLIDTCPLSCNKEVVPVFWGQTGFIHHSRRVLRFKSILGRFTRFFLNSVIKSSEQRHYVFLSVIINHILNLKRFWKRNFGFPILFALITWVTFLLENSDTCTCDNRVSGRICDPGDYM